jgi:hypothetical protein
MESEQCTCQHNGYHIVTQKISDTIQAIDTYFCHCKEDADKIAERFLNLLTLENK